MDSQGTLVARVPMEKNRMFKLNLNYVEKCLQTSSENMSMLWHQRFGHLHFGGLKELVKKGMVRDLPSSEYESSFCEGCVLGKHVRQPFQKQAGYRAKGILETIHSDICGPITPESFSGKRYFITFIDDYSRKS